MNCLGSSPSVVAQENMPTILAKVPKLYSYGLSNQIFQKENIICLHFTTEIIACSNLMFNGIMKNICSLSGNDIVFESVNFSRQASVVFRWAREIIVGSTDLE